MTAVNIRVTRIAGSNRKQETKKKCQPGSIRETHARSQNETEPHQKQVAVQFVITVNDLNGEEEGGDKEETTHSKTATQTFLNHEEKAAK